MANYRRGRINDEMLKEIATVLREVKDPRVQDAFVSVTAAEVTPDLKYAKIYYSFLRGDNAKEVATGLKAASGYIRRQIAQRMNLRITPELAFVLDHSIAHGAHISSLLHSIEKTDSANNENTDSAEENK